MVGQELEDGAAHASIYDSVFDGDDVFVAFCHFLEEMFVDGLEEEHVVVCYGYVVPLVGGFHLCYGNGFGGFNPYWTDGEHCCVVAVFELSSSTDGYLFHLCVPVYHGAAASGVSDDEGTLAWELGCVHEVAQVALVEGRGYCEVGDGSEVCHVVGSVVCGAVFAHYACPVEAEDHVEAHGGCIVDDVVVGSLHEGGVDVAEGHEAVFCHAAGECHGVSFGYAHVEDSVGHGVHHDVHRASCGHGRCDSDDARVLLCQFEECLAEYVLELWRTGGAVVGCDALA